MPAKGWRKQLCIYNHDISIVGRDKWGECIECKRIYRVEHRDDLYQWRKENKDKVIAIKERHHKIHPESRRLSNLKAKIGRGLRARIEFGQEGVAKFFANCPIGMTVDHVIPLLGNKVSGLNVIWNLQYLTHVNNSIKNNKVDLLEVSAWYGKVLEQAGLK